MTDKILSYMKRLRGILPKKLNRYHYIAFFAFTVVAGFFGFTNPVAALSGITGNIVDGFLQFFTWLMLIVANLCIGLTIFFLRFFISIAAYNNYIDVDVVQLGWIMIRDVSNMFFVVALLVIAFGTILGIEEYEWKKNLVKLILAAILINFSNLIAQLVIDVAHVFTITFLNAIASTAGGNIINMFKLNEITSMVGAAGEDLGNVRVELAAGALAATGFAILAAVAMGSYAFVMTIRVVVLWGLIILAPLACILSVLPKTKSYSDRWLSEFSKHVIVAPVMVFFLWLSFATLGNGQIAQDIQRGQNESTKLSYDRYGYKTTEAYSTPTLSLSKVTTWESMASFFIAMAFMYYGLEFTQETGARGSGAVAGAISFGKKVATIATGYAAGRWLVGKGSDLGKRGALGLGKKIAMNLPIIGGQKWVNLAKKTGSLATIGWNKVSQWRDRGAKALEAPSKGLKTAKIEKEREQSQADLDYQNAKNKPDYAENKGEVDREYGKKTTAINDKYEAKVAAAKASGLGGGNVVGRFGRMVLAGFVESGAREAKKVDNLAKAAESEKAITEAEFSTSWTIGGQMKISGKARLELEERKQKGKAETKVADLVTYMTNKEKLQYEGAQDVIKGHGTASKEIEESEKKIAEIKDKQSKMANVNSQEYKVLVDAEIAEQTKKTAAEAKLGVYAPNLSGAKETMQNLGKRGLVYSAISAEAKLKAAKAVKEGADAEMTAVYMSGDDGKKLTTIINLAEEAKHAADEFIKELKNKDLQHHFTHAAEKMSAIMKIGLEKGADAMKKKLDEASRKDVTIRALGRAQEAKTSEEATGIRRRQAEDAAKNAFISMPRYGTTSASTAMSDFSESKMKDYRRLERGAAARKASEVMAELNYQKSQGKTLDIDQEAELFTASTFLNENAWNDDQKDHIKARMDDLKAGRLQGAEKARWAEMAKSMAQLGWFQDSGGDTVEKDVIDGDGNLKGDISVKRAYGRKQAADLQALAITGNDVELIKTHNKIAEEADANAFLVAQESKKASDDVMKAEYAKIESNALAGQDVGMGENVAAAVNATRAVDGFDSESDAGKKAMKEAVQKAMLGVEEIQEAIATATQGAVDKFGKSYWDIAKELLPNLATTGFTTIDSADALKARYAKYSDFMQDATKANKDSALKNGHTQLGYNQDFDEGANLYRFQTINEASRKMSAERAKMKRSQLLGDQYHSHGILDETGIIDDYNTDEINKSSGGAQKLHEIQGMADRTKRGHYYIHKEGELVVKTNSEGVKIATVGGKEIKVKMAADGHTTREDQYKHMMLRGMLPLFAAGAKAAALEAHSLFSHTTEMQAKKGIINLNVAGTEIGTVKDMADEIIRLLKDEKNADKVLKEIGSNLFGRGAELFRKMKEASGMKYDDRPEPEPDVASS